MKPKGIMLIAGEPSGDLLAAELVRELRSELALRNAAPTTDLQPLRASLEPRFFGAGGRHLAAAGSDLVCDMTAHSVIGLWEVFKKLLQFRRIFHRLRALALARQPDAVVCVDFSGFNRRFAHSIRQYVRTHHDWFHDWTPKIIQYVSPQVWASRESRVYQLARDYDLLLSIFPFEKSWYTQRVPHFRVEFVGHPMVDRYGRLAECQPEAGEANAPLVLLLPGSRRGELARHLPVLLPAVEKIRAEFPGLRAKMILPDAEMLALAKAHQPRDFIELQIGGLAALLSQATMAIASTGTVTLECAYFRIPTLAFYKTSWSTWQIGKRLARVRYAAMPNLLANDEIFPEFLQDAATPANLARAGISLLRDPARRQAIRSRLLQIAGTLGSPGASHRAAVLIADLLDG
jgi:lipid-A-disaccharide synthase